MIQIDYEKCIGCGKCLYDCQRNDIQIIEGKAHPLNNTCMSCGHCIAVCPREAVRIIDYDMNDVEEFNYNNFAIKPENLLNFIKYRRTIRHFKNQQVEKEKIEKIIEAGRFSPTGGNRQHLSYIVVQENIKKLANITMEALYNYACSYERGGLEFSNGLKRYTQVWKQMREELISGNDLLFHNAPTLIIILSNINESLSPVVEESLDGGLAASNMELMANALNLGVCFNGFFTFASNDKKVRTLLNISDKEKVVTAFLVGYPDVKFIRTVPRKKPTVKWL